MFNIIINSYIYINIDIIYRKIYIIKYILISIF